MDETHAFHYPLPSFYYVDICNICNLRCPFCPTGQRRNGLTKGRMSKERYADILYKISPYAKQIHFYHWGEPFLNEDIIPIISMTAERKIFTAVHSNLTMRDISKEEAERIVRSGLSFLNVSLDGASQETYERYRVGGDFERVIRNIQKLQKAKKDLNIDMPIRWRFLINAFNEHEQGKAITLAQQLGVIMQFELMGVTDNSWATKYHDERNSQKWPQIISPNEIPEEINLFPSAPIQLHSMVKPFCIQPFNWMTVNVNGHVSPCCSVYGDQYSVGNIFDSSLDEVWNGVPMLQCREYLANYGPRQDGGSICGTKPCGVKRKFVSDSNVVCQADVEVQFVSGVWVEEAENWLWLSNQAEFNVLPKDSGVLSFDFIVPAQEQHKKMLPLLIDIWIGNEKLDQVRIENVRTVKVSFPVSIGKAALVRISVNKYFIPDQLLGNGDKRKLSLIVDNFAVTPS